MNKMTSHRPSSEKRRMVTDYAEKHYGLSPSAVDKIVGKNWKHAAPTLFAAIDRHENFDAFLTVDVVETQTSILGYTAIIELEQQRHASVTLMNARNSTSGRHTINASATNAMTPDKARELAHLLLSVADHAENLNRTLDQLEGE